MFRPSLSSSNRFLLRVLPPLTSRAFPSLLPLSHFSSSFFETSRTSLHPLSTLTLRSFASTSRGTSPPTLSSLEHIADLNPHDPSHQSRYLHSLSAVDPLAVVRRVESGRYATSADVMLEYEKAKNRLDALHYQYPPSSPPQAPHGHAYYASPSSSSYAPTYPPTYSSPSYSSAPSPPPLGSSTHPISVTIVKEADTTPRTWISRIRQWLGLALPIVLVGGVFYILLSPASGGGSFMSRSHVKEFKHDGDVPKVLFTDVKGCDEAKGELEEIVAYLRNPSHFEKLGGKMVKGILLTGPPGTGKTLLAKAIAGEAHVPFFSCSGSDFEEMFVGVGARRIRDLFAAARKKSPCIIFIDEIDAVGSKRSGRDVQAARLSLNQLLVEMDGFDVSLIPHSPSAHISLLHLHVVHFFFSRLALCCLSLSPSPLCCVVQKTNGVIVIGATNLPSLLDAALTRPGRFDRHVAVPVPDLKGRKAILDLYAKKIPLSDDVNLDILARGTPGCTGAQLFNLINSAALKASSKGLTAVSMKELEYAKDKILMGAERANIMSPDERKLTAYHEGGHALVALYTKHALPLYKATILPRGQALGVTHFLPENDMLSQTKAQLMSSLDVAMGGRVAEELIFGSDMVTTGASSDLQGATNIARRMVTQYGMSEKVGLSVVEEDATLSVEKRQRLDAEVDTLLKESYGRATQILSTHIHHLHSIAHALLVNETLSAKEMQDVLQKEGLIGEEEVRQLVEAEKRKEAELKGKKELIEDTKAAGKRPGGVEVLGVGIGGASLT